MAIYCKFGSIKGNVTAKGFEGQINLTSLHFGVSRAISMETGNLSNRESAKPQLSEIQVTKKADNSVAGLLKEALVGAAGQEAVITFVRTAADSLQEFMSYKLTDCMVSSYSISAAGDEEPVENLSLSYSRIEVSYKDYDATNKAGSPQRVSYNVTQGVAA